MSSFINTTKEGLRGYILRRLGSPVINVEITTEQLDDSIHEALQLFFTFGHGGYQARSWIMPTVIDQQEYALPYEVQAVLGIFDGGEIFGGIGGGGNTSQSTVNQIFTVKNYVAYDVMKGSAFSGRGGLLQIEMINQYMTNLKLKLDTVIDFEFNTATKNLYLYEKPGNVSQYLVIGYEHLDSASVEDQNIFDHVWIKNYATEISRRQWGWNLMKYEGSVLPGGLTLNPAGILSEAKENITKAEEDLHSMYELPADFFIGGWLLPALLTVGSALLSGLVFGVPIPFV